eukprot:2878191-Prymnesium_polylepis.1
MMVGTDLTAAASVSSTLACGRRPQLPRCRSSLARTGRRRRTQPRTPILWPQSSLACARC